MILRDYEIMQATGAPVVLEGHRRLVKAVSDKILVIINDWAILAHPDYDGDGEADFKAKYGKDTTELIDVIKEALETN